MGGAVAVATYFIDHALAAFGLMGAEGPLDDAGRVRRWIFAGRRPSFTRRECHRAHEARFHRSEDLDPVLDLLEEHRWIRRVAEEQRPGRPSERYEVNPSLYSTGPTKPTKRDLDTGSAGSVGFADGNAAHDKDDHGDSASTRDDPMLRAALEIFPGAHLEDG